MGKGHKMRRIHAIRQEWTFTNIDGAQSVVQLPHTWNAKDGQDGGDDYRRGMAVYETKVAAPEYDADTEVVYLQFHGVNASAKVFFNGTEVMCHDGGYSTFRGEITYLLQKDNALRVEVDNSKNTRVYPQMADFTFYGGIYRDVEFLILPKVHFDVDYYGGTGIQVTPSVEGDKAEIQVKTYLGRCCEGLSVQVSLLDQEGNQAAQQLSWRIQGQNQQTKGADEADRAYEVILTLDNPHLWNGIADPYLYTVVAELIDDKNQVIDKVTAPCGIRTIAFDPEEGFFLNGKSYPLRGVSRHQDWKGIGNAITKEHMEQDMALIKEIGANTIRLAHYQHDQYFYDLCDREGMVVWAEIPYISHHMPEGNANTKSQMKELIVQNYNHPSICMWGISNEITIKVTNRKDMLQNHRELQALVEEMDPTRPSTMACYAMCGPLNRVTKITDLIAWNLYLGWYVPFLWLNDLWIGGYHLLFPKRCLGYSEYGAEGMPNLHSERPHRGDNTEEYQNIYHEYMLKCFKRHPYMWGTYVWNMFDFAADARNQGGEPGMNHKGMITFDRKVKKDCFYLYKAHWKKAQENDADAFVYIAGRRFTYRRGKKQKITVYSNQPEVALYLNDQLVETKAGEGVFSFKVNLKEGENILEARAGKLVDQITLIQTKDKHPEYKMQKVDTKNWM